FKEMTSFIVENDIREYEDLWIYAMENRFDDWFPLLADNGTFAINTFIKSRRHRIKDKD
ncbi:replication protein, partial [Staphylococcus epidermidis]